LARAEESLAVPTQATSEEIVKWLQGDDSRMAAWGATFAAKNHDVTVVPYLARLAEEWVPLAIGYNPDGSYLVRTEAEKVRLREMDAVLDSLIQLHGTVTPEAIRRLDLDFPGPAQILFAYLPEPDRRRFAQSVYAERQVGAEYWTQWPLYDEMSPRKIPPMLPGFETWDQQYLAGSLISFAALLLEKDPPPGFVASLLNESTMPLEIWVGAERPISMSGGGSFWFPPEPKGWPEHWTYTVEAKWPAVKQAKAADAKNCSPDDEDGCSAADESAESDQGAKDMVIVPGNPALVAQRSIPPHDQGVGMFGSEVRLQLLYVLIGDYSQKPGGRMQESESIKTTDEVAFQSAVLRGVLKREQEFRVLVSALAAKGLLSADEAQSAWPTLKVKVVDLREMKTPALPEIKLPVGLQKVMVVGAGE
jgi:hypothetical protein